MHSVFWTLAKSNLQAAAAQNAGGSSAWGENRMMDILPPFSPDNPDHSHNAFIQESAIDEIAFAGGADPLDLRRKLMSPYPAAVRLIDAIERLSGWKTSLPAGRARGFAFAFSSGVWIAQVVEVVQEGAGIRIEKMYCAVDVGRVFNEREFRDQLLAATLRDLSSATGRRVTRDTCPEIAVDLLISSSKPLGRIAGLVIPPVTPALSNAVFALTGKRIRRMPLVDEVEFV